MQKLRISILIPNYNSEKTIGNTIESVEKQIKNIDAEIIVVDDCSTDNSIGVVKKYKNVKIYKNKKNFGPAKTRNYAIKKASAEILAFIDSDCEAQDNWIVNILNHFKNPEIQVIMGNVFVPSMSYVADSISALGFPGGGSIGFDKMWRIDKEGNTKHITSCNFAIKKEVFSKYDGFDESFPMPGGEDNELAIRLSNNGIKIKYCSDMLVYHVPRSSVKSFVKWMFLRGRCSFYFKKKVGKIGGFIKLRLWSTKNIIIKNIFNKKIFLIIPLIFIFFVMQFIGYYYEVRKVKS